MRICPRCGTPYEHERFCPEDGVATQDVAVPEIGTDTLLGQVIDGRYRIEERIGEGGMGVVYRGTHIALNKTIAVKVLRGEMARDADTVQRFAQEAQAASSIGHENIIDISDFGRLPDGNAYFVMEYLKGRSLSELIKLGGALPVSDALSILRQVAGALGAAHQRGIVHRDLKPDNVYILRRGELENFVKVLDFGIAKVGSTNNKLTRTGTVFGTPHYMSPEQAAGQSVDARTDIYALGVIMYEMFTGRVPFDADTFMAVLTKHMFEQPAPMQSPHAGRYLGALERITMRALQKKQELRYQSMFELMDDLDVAAGGGSPSLTHATRPSAALADALEPRSKSEMELPQPGTEPVLPTHRPPWALIGAGALGLVLAVLAWSLLSRGPAQEALAVPHVPAPLAPAAAAAPMAGASSAPVPISAAQAAVPAKPDPTPEAVEMIALSSVPSGASVLVDGAIAGTTPLRLPRPSQAAVRVALHANGYQDEEVRLDAHSPVGLQVAMRRARAGTRKQPAAASSGGAPTAAGKRTTVARQSEVLDPWAN